MGRTGLGDGEGSSKGRVVRRSAPSDPPHFVKAIVCTKHHEHDKTEAEEELSDEPKRADGADSPGDRL